MSIELWQALKSLKARIEALEGKPASPSAPVEEKGLSERLTKLENSYRMLNARMARGKTD